MRRAVPRFFVGASLVVALVLPLSGADLAGISGHVRDTRGIPLVGALVIIQSALPWTVERSALTDRRGHFSVSNLLPGSYSIRVSQTRFLPTVRDGIQLTSGGSAILTISLQTALDVLQRTANRANAEDIKWTLRSAPSTQPILRLADAQQARNESPDVTKGSDGTEYSGYFSVFSRSYENPSGATTDAVGSQFAVTLPVASNSQVTVVGQYSEAAQQPRGFGAKYEFTPGERHRSRLGVNVRQGAMFASAIPNADDLREVNVEYGEDLQWSSHLRFNYGAEIGHADAVTDRSYLRPRFGASWAPAARTTVSGMVTTQAPVTGLDETGVGPSYFERLVYIPPALERYSHAEAGVAQVLSENSTVSLAFFRDRIDTHALFLESPEGQRGVLILDSSRMPSFGVRMHADRRVRNVDLGLGYTFGSGLGLTGIGLADRLPEHLVRRRFHMAVARVAADLDLIQTEITAVYRWISGFSAAHLDPYQRFSEYNDPSLSLSIIQNLPRIGLLPGKLQAVVDARNLFDQSYGASRYRFAQSPRLLKGGISLKF